MSVPTLRQRLRLAIIVSAAPLMAAVAWETIQKTRSETEVARSAARRIAGLAGIALGERIREAFDRLSESAAGLPAVAGTAACTPTLHPVIWIRPDGSTCSSPGTPTPDQRALSRVLDLLPGLGDPSAIAVVEPHAGDGGLLLVHPVTEGNGALGLLIASSEIAGLLDRRRLVTSDRLRLETADGQVVAMAGDAMPDTGQHARVPQRWWDVLATAGKAVESSSVPHTALRVVGIVDRASTRDWEDWQPIVLNLLAMIAALMLAILLARQQLRRVTAHVQGMVAGLRSIAAGASVVRPPGGYAREFDAMNDAFMDMAGARDAALRERDRRAAEQLQAVRELQRARRFESIGRLAGGIAHDFNNLLAVIVGRTEAAAEQLPPEQPARRHLDEVARAGRHAARLIDELLDFAREQHREGVPTDLNAFVQDHAEIIADVLGSDIRLQLDLMPGLGPVVFDAGGALRILTNLAANARNATEGRGKVTLSTANVAAVEARRCTTGLLTPGRYVELAFRDTGRGMDAATLDRLFEPFFSTSRHRGGVGLGLATTLAIVEQFDGMIDVSSIPGEGTIFRILLPRIPDDARADLPSRPHDPP